MDTCKANKCTTNSSLIYKGMRSKWNDFERCSKPVFKDGFCKRCYNHDQRFKSHLWIPDQLWKRDGIYGEPYDFPYHKTEYEKKWVQMIYELHPHLKPKQKIETHEEKIEKIKKWFNDNKNNISYEAGIELNGILN